MNSIVWFSILGFFLATAQAFPDKRTAAGPAADVIGNSPALNAVCPEAVDLAACGHVHGLHMSLNEVFGLMAVDARWLTSACRNERLDRCLVGCQRSFLRSRLGYAYALCAHKNVVVGSSACWDADFPEQARRCLALHYPEQRLRVLHPTPMRVYNESTVARDCFAGEAQPCRHWKSFVLNKLMPQYF